MALLEIVLYPDPTLRERCVTVEKITDELRELLDDMSDTMYNANGIGLAAAQIGSPHRLIVVDVGKDPESEAESTLYKLVNPEIVHTGGTVRSEEGCLSIPDVRETVQRHESIVVSALNELGEKVQIEADGLLSICLQHEIDHLDGVLFIDKISRLRRNFIKPKLKKLSEQFHS